MNRGFFRAGHLPTLIAAFLYFDVSFMVWVVLGPLAVFISRDLHLTPGEKGLMVATPVLAGAALRIVGGRPLRLSQASPHRRHHADGGDRRPRRLLGLRRAEL
jgi:NNP family nitrate/nitrite transporter-like MFS transporter